jgi:hypothetical protein
VSSKRRIAAIIFKLPSLAAHGLLASAWGVA